jgi:CubicO group peptidase (beta-lactamase class C family)
VQTNLLSVLKTLSQQLSLLLLFPGLYVSAVKGQSNLAINDSIDRLLSSWESKQTPGISIAVVKNGNVIYSKSLGMANIKLKAVNDSLTTFWIASVTKQFTAAAIYTLALQKKLVLDKSVRTYLPGLPALYQSITINQLIHHTSGTRDGFVLTALSKKPPSGYTNENVLAYLKASEDLNFTPGSKFEYNNGGYVLLATVIEKLSGKSYPVYMKEMIFGPIGMKDTYISPSFPTDTKQAEGYREAEPGTYQEFHFEGKTYGSTGVITTLRDLTRWSQFLQDPHRIPSLATVAEQLLKTGYLRTKQSIAYAGGLEKFTYRGRTVFEHFGSDEGFKADILYFPKSKVSVIGLTNNDSYYGLLQLLFQVSDFVHDGKLPRQTLVGETGSIISEEFYYNDHIPQFIKLQNYPGFAKISSTYSGYAAPYRVIGDTLRSPDPIPSQFLKRNQQLEVLNTYYPTITQLHAIQPVSSKNDLHDFIGEYTSPELNTSYKITATEKGLQFEFVPGVVFDLFRITATDFQFDYLGANYVQFTKDGFAFSREGCRKLVFKKQ